MRVKKNIKGEQYEIAIINFMRSQKNIDCSEIKLGVGRNYFHYRCIVKNLKGFYVPYLFWIDGEYISFGLIDTGAFASFKTSDYQNEINDLEIIKNRILKN